MAKIREDVGDWFLAHRLERSGSPITAGQVVPPTASFAPTAEVHDLQEP